MDIPQVDDIYLNKVLPEPNDAKRGQYLTELGNAMFDSHQHIPLFWVPVQVAYDPRIVSQYVFPGSTSGLYTHLEGVKAAR